MNRRWLVVGLVTAAVLFAAGWVVGHLTSTTGDAEQQRWREENEQLLGPRREVWQQAVSLARREAALAVMAAEAALDSAAAREAQRPTGDATAAQLRATTDSLRRLTEIVTSAEEAIPILTGLVASVTAERDHAIGQVEEERETSRLLRSAIGSQATALAALGQRIAADSTRIADLEGQLEKAPKGDRWKLSIWGLDIRPGAAVIWNGDKVPSVGLGLVVTP